MRVFIIDTSNMAPELQGGLLGVEGSSNPTTAEKRERIATVSSYVMDGWAIAADPSITVGWLAAIIAETACVPFVNLTRIVLEEPAQQPAPARSLVGRGIAMRALKRFEPKAPPRLT